MKFCVFLFVLAGTICPAQSNPATAPVQSSSQTPQTGVVMTKLSPPIYPPLARQARIMGDVKLKVDIRPDGSVESAEVISGHPILKLAALDSAKNSVFECRGCEGPQTSSLVYNFVILDTAEFKPDPCCCSTPPKRPVKDVEPQMNMAAGLITISVPTTPVCMCPDECDERRAEEHSRYRSLKCLYLWKCGKRRVYLE